MKEASQVMLKRPYSDMWSTYSKQFFIISQHIPQKVYRDLYIKTCLQINIPILLRKSPSFNVLFDLKRSHAGGRLLVFIYCSIADSTFRING